MANIITLTTDFGLQGPYVASMKGVILSINPQATLVDISHHVAPQNVFEAAFLLGNIYRYFPRDSVHIVIVDPGVGTKRRGIVLEIGHAFFVAPDNGLLSYVLEEELGHGMVPPQEASPWKGGLPPLYERELRAPVQARTISNPKLWRHPISATFHGRDIFAPVAAHLSLGIPLAEVGEAVSSVLAFDPPHPRLEPDGSVQGQVIHIDSFGNLITNMREADLPAGPMDVLISGSLIVGLSSTYHAGADLLALIGSGGNLEIAAKNASAAAMLQAKVGDVVKIVSR